MVVSLCFSICCNYLLTQSIFQSQIIHLKRFQFVNGRWIKSQKIVKFPREKFDPSAFLVPQGPAQYEKKRAKLQVDDQAEPRLTHGDQKKMEMINFVAGDVDTVSKVQPVISSSIANSSKGTIIYSYFRVIIYCHPSVY